MIFIYAIGQPMPELFQGAKMKSSEISHQTLPGAQTSEH